MKTVAIISQKGGAGKTTVTLNLAVAAERAKQSAVVIDLDPQTSATSWKDNRKAETPVVIALPHTRLSQGLTAAGEGGAKWAFIDSAPHTEGGALAAAEAADLILIPCRPGILDLRAIGATAKLTRIAGKRAFVLLNSMPVRASGVLADAREAVAVHGLTVAPIVIHQRAAYAHALTSGQTAQEFEPDGKAAQETANLLKWLRSEI